MSLCSVAANVGVWYVYVRWLTDSEKYNEWMNPIDYETEAGAAARESAEAGLTAIYKAPPMPDACDICLITAAMCKLQIGLK